MALSFIGKPISLISHSDIRYRGILAGIDPAASTIQLSNVYSMGTESRRPPAEFIPPVQEPYQYIVFRASEVKDLAVDEPTPRRSVHDDPAVLGASAPSVPAAQYGQYGAPTAAYPPKAPHPQIQPQPSQSSQPHQQQSQQKSMPQPPQQQQQPTRPAQQHDQAVPNTSSRPSGQGRRSTNSVQTATASLETVGRALGDLRLANGTATTTTSSGSRQGRRGHGQQGGASGVTPTTQDVKASEFKVPTTDFDFQSSNALFDKAALMQRKGKDASETTDGTATEDVDGDGAEKGEEKETVAYNPQKSFFDLLSSSTQGPGSRGEPGGVGRGGRRGGGAGRNRREEERERNVATFGEPGGTYNSAWGGHGRRGGRSRRGTPVGRERA